MKPKVLRIGLAVLSIAVVAIVIYIGERQSAGARIWLLLFLVLAAAGACTLAYRRLSRNHQ